MLTPASLVSSKAPAGARLSDLPPVHAKLTTMVTDRDTVCFLAGSVYIVWCEIEEVVTCGCTRKHVEIVVTPSTWREYAPWCTTHQNAVDCM